MNSFSLALGAVMPMFLYLLLGRWVRTSGLADKHTLDQVNMLCFKTFLAISVYYNIYVADIKELFDAKLLTYSIASQGVILGVSLVAALVTEKDRKRRGALAHGIFHTNFVIFGTLIGTALCGEGKIGTIALLIAVIVPVQNVVSIILLEFFKEGKRESSGGFFLSVLKNPYVIAALAGFLTQLLHIDFPEVFVNVLRDLGRCGAPVAMMVMGGLFNFDVIRHNLKAIGVGVVFRLILIPAVMLTITIALGFRGTDLVGLMCIFIAPCATSSFNLATAMESDADLASHLVVFTSLISLGTIFFWIYLLSEMGYLIL